MAHHNTPDIDPNELKNAEDMWHAFTIGGKYAIILIALILIGLALGFVNFS